MNSINIMNSKVGYTIHGHRDRAITYVFSKAQKQPWYTCQAMINCCWEQFDTLLIHPSGHMPWSAWVTRLGGRSVTWAYQITPVAPNTL